MEKLNKITPIQNKVLLRPLQNNKEYKVGNKTIILVSEVPGSTYNVLYEVIEWDRKIDFKFKKGDVVIADYLEALAVSGEMPKKSGGNPSFIQYGSEKYIFLDYKCMYVVKRGDKIIVLHDYFLLEPIKEGVKTSLIVPNHLKSRKSARFGIVRFTPEDSGEIKIGDKVMFGDYSVLELEPRFHETLKGKEAFWKILRQHIMGVVEGVSD